MKTKWLFMCTLICLLLCCSCKPTPDKAPVVNKIGGIHKDSILAPLDDGSTRKYDVPSRWKETIKKGGERTVVNADLNIELPEIGNTPIIEVEKLPFEEKDLRRLIQYFAGDGKICAPQPLLREELEHHLRRMENREGYYGNPIGSSYLRGQIENLKALLKSAPQERGEKQYIEPVFEEFSQSEYSYVMFGLKNPSGNKNTFRGVQKENGATIKATVYDEKDGLKSSFVYEIGQSFDKNHYDTCRADYKNLTKNKSVAQEWMDSYKDYIEHFADMLEEEFPDREQIIQEAEKLLEDLNISELVLSELEPCLWFPKEDNWDYMDVDWTDARTGFALLFTRGTEELPCYIPRKSVNFQGLPETTYTPPFKPEIVVMVYTEDGLRLFQWDNMAKDTAIIAENTELMDFDAIKERLATHLYYTDVALDNESDIDQDITTEYTITGVRLCYTYVNAYNKPSQAWLVPAWEFTYIRKISNDSFKKELGTMLQAIDGGYISFQVNEL